MQDGSTKMAVVSIDFSYFSPFKYTMYILYVP